MLAAWRRPPVTMVMSLFKTGPPPPGPHPGETRRLSRIHAAGTSASSHAGVHSSKETPSITSSVLGCSQLPPVFTHDPRGLVDPTLT